jgi:hypothetical protein
MKYEQFKTEMYEKARKNKQKRPLISDIQYFYNKYDITCDLVKDKYKAKKLSICASFSKVQRLRYRNELAETGVELTPDQINYYINMICIILKEQYNIDV